MSLGDFITKLVVDRATAITLRRMREMSPDCMDLDDAARQAKKDVAGWLRQSADLLDPSAWVSV